MVPSLGQRRACCVRWSDWRGVGPGLGSPRGRAAGGPRLPHISWRATRSRSLVSRCGTRPGPTPRQPDPSPRPRGLIHREAAGLTLRELVTVSIHRETAGLTLRSSRPKTHISSRRSLIQRRTRRAPTRCTRGRRDQPVRAVWGPGEFRSGQPIFAASSLATTIAELETPHPRAREDCRARAPHRPRRHEPEHPRRRSEARSSRRGRGVRWPRASRRRSAVRAFGSARSRRTFLSTGAPTPRSRASRSAARSS